MKNSEIDLLLNEKNKVLIDINLLAHFSDGKMNSIICFHMTFDDDMSVNIRNAADGESLIISSEDPEEIDLQEYGLTKIISFDEHDPVRNRSLVGKRLDGLRALLGTRNDNIRAIELSFGSEIMSVVNDFDELRFRDTIEDVSVREGERVVLYGAIKPTG